MQRRVHNQADIFLNAKAQTAFFGKSFVRQPTHSHTHAHTNTVSRTWQRQNVLTLTVCKARFRSYAVAPLSSLSSLSISLSPCALPLLLSCAAEGACGLSVECSFERSFRFARKVQLIYVSSCKTPQSTPAAAAALAATAAA